MNMNELATAKREHVPVVEIIMDIAGYLEVPVVAEGVETEEQLKLVKQVGCRFVQGFYFSKPVPAGEVEKLLKA